MINDKRLISILKMHNKFKRIDIDYYIIIDNIHNDCMLFLMSICHKVIEVYFF